MEGFIYFVYDENINYIKLGRTKDRTLLPSRYRTTMISPNIYFYNVTDCIKAEKYLHYLAKDYHIIRELFRITKKQAVEFCEMAQNNFKCNNSEVFIYENAGSKKNFINPLQLPDEFIKNKFNIVLDKIPDEYSLMEYLEMCQDKDEKKLVYDKLICISNNIKKGLGCINNEVKDIFSCLVDANFVNKYSEDFLYAEDLLIWNIHYYKNIKCLFDKIKSKSKIHSYLFENLDINLFESIVHLYDLYNISSILKTRQLDSFIPFISNESIKQNIINYINIYKHIPDCFIVCFKSEIKDFIIDINNMLSDFFPIFCLLGEKKIQFYYYIYILMNHLGVENIEDNTCVPRNKLANIPEIFILSLRKNLCINHSSMRLKEIILTINVVLSTIGFRLSTSTDPSIKSKRKRKVIDGETVDITNYNIIANYNSLYNCII